jgi:hypothetical protein
VSTKPGQLQSEPEKRGWKDQPLAIAAITAVGTISILVFLYKEVVIPTQTASLQNEISSLRKQMNLPDDEAGGIRALRKKVDDLEKQLSSANAKLAEAQLTNLFSFGNPYPSGLAQVKIGDRIELIDRTYPSNSIDRSRGGYWSVKTGHSAFESVTYYFDRNSAEKRVTHMLFFFQSSCRRLVAAEADRSVGTTDIKSGERRICVEGRSQTVCRKREAPLFTAA